ncbi:MAG TPA: hypothetical protein VGJ26_12120 [Pirellulales bacterium]|jgi:hypothetical protein
MSSDPDILSIAAALRRFPELDECIIGFEGDGQSRVLDYGKTSKPNSRCVGIIIEEVEADPESDRELVKMAALKSAPPAVLANRSRVVPELVGAGVSCALTTFSAIGVLAGVAGEIPTGGASTFLIVSAWTGLTMGGIQCLNGLVRVGTIFASPDDNTLQRWDSNLSYSMSILLVDALGVASGLASLPFAARNLWAALCRQRVFVAKGLTMDSLRVMNRAERMRAISEVFEDAAKTSEGREALVRAAREAQIGPQTFQRAAGISVRHAQSLRRIISDETVRRITASVRDVLTSVAVTGASATPASMTGSASGSINYLINLIDAGAPNRN